MAPSGRGSIRQNGMSTRRGANHWAKCSASVHTRNTSSRGASTRRESFRSAAASGQVNSFFTFGLLITQSPDVGFHAVETLVPDHALAADPVLGGRQRGRLEV